MSSASHLSGRLRVLPGSKGYLDGRASAVQNFSSVQFIRTLRQRTSTQPLYTALPWLLRRQHMRAAFGVWRAPLRGALPRGRVRGKMRAARREDVPLRRALQDAAVLAEAAVRAQVPAHAHVRAPRVQAAVLRRRLRAVRRGVQTFTLIFTLTPNPTPNRASYM